MAFGNRQRLRVHHTKASTLGWSVVVGLYKQMTPPISNNQPKKYSMFCFAVSADVLNNNSIPSGCYAHIITGSGPWGQGC